jgi:hypothetical protein
LSESVNGGDDDVNDDVNDESGAKRIVDDGDNDDKDSDECDCNRHGHDNGD